MYKYRNVFFFSIVTFSILFFSCNSRKKSLIEGTWNLKHFDMEIKVDGKFEKIDSTLDIGAVFNKINFVNQNEFSYHSKGISNDDVTLIGGVGFYKIKPDKIKFEYEMQIKSMNYKLNSTQLILIEEHHYEPSEPLILTAPNNSQLKITETRFTYYYKR